MAAKKPPVGERWAEIDKRFKPSKAASKDTMRPALQYGHIRHRKNGSFLCITDAYILVELPITFDCPRRDLKAALPEVGLPLQALKALDASKTGRFRVTEQGLVEIDGSDALFRVGTELNAPSFKDLWPDEFKETEKLDGIPAIGFNPAYMHRAAEAMGQRPTGRDHACKVQFIGPLRPILVEPLLGGGARALVMPVRMREN